MCWCSWRKALLQSEDYRRHSTGIASLDYDGDGTECNGTSLAMVVVVGPVKKVRKQQREQRYDHTEY